MTDDLFLQLLARSLPLLQDAFGYLPQAGPPGGQPPEIGRMSDILDQVAGRMADNYPYFHPLYAGQMLKPPHPLAHAAYALAMWLNPNNHALDGGRASSRMEIEAVRAIGAIFGWQNCLGHLSSSGTFANLEALWIGGQVSPDSRVVASEQAHYTHGRISAVLGLPFASIATDRAGRMDPMALEASLREGNVGTVVATMGSTATGAVDPLDKVLALKSKYSFRIHADAAYGGYFTLAENIGEEAARAFQSLAQADSIVVDPHKHGLQPYGCGCVLFRDPAVGRFYQHDSPYTYFTSEELHLGEISLECSRAGASAAALWATQQLLPLTRGGEFSRDLARSRQAAIILHGKLAADRRFLVPFAPELDILVWTVRAPTLAASSRLAKRIFAVAARENLHLALTQLPLSFFRGAWPRENANPEASVTCLRSVLMKPEHLDWIDAIWSKLNQAADEVLADLNAEEGGSDER